MARNLQPKHHMCRRIGEKLCDLDRCPTVRRNYGPGIHGPKMHRKLTEYGTQLLEKQKARAVYGILERQLRRYYDEAIRRPGNTGQILTELLETRLDNIVFRLGFAKSRAAARQMVGHRHITVNGKRVSIPSFHVRSGDVIAVEERRRGSPLFTDLPRLIGTRTIPAWLAVEPEKFQGRLIRLPTAEDVQQPFRTQSIVEFYSR
ncbi:30S ribosomal protein S4 [Candidatus Uhrbacteria bacterium]|nr:30S ribosomal protein S4 [Candidatus Uhrbacteria bacterium]